MEQSVLKILNQLIACDTQNPPREISTGDEIFKVIRRQLADFEFSMTDHGMGRISLFAQRGQPRLLFNVHLDTVPVGGGWTRPPLELTIDGDRAFGRGACDIKGAAACLIAAAQSSSDDMAILFTTDEEGAESCCVQEFCESTAFDSIELVVVAEPTECRVVAEHRGYLSVQMEFRGDAGHTSNHDRLPQSAVHQAIRWVTEALETVDNFERGELSQLSCCFNVGRIDGGIKNNMIADRCKVGWSARMPPGFDNEQLLQRLMLQDDRFVTWQTTFQGPSLPGRPEQAAAVSRWATECKLPLGTPVDFWTEASIFSTYQTPALVLGPGHIGQAHAADEWVSVQQLVQACHHYRRMTECSNHVQGII